MAYAGGLLLAVQSALRPRRPRMTFTTTVTFTTVTVTTSTFTTVPFTRLTFTKGASPMTIHQKLPADIIGLAHQVAPLSRRGFFMSASAAAAAGYTLAAGPVRAQAITTDTQGLTAGEAKVKVAGGDMPVYFAKPANATNPPVILVAMEIFGLHEYIKDVARRLAKLGAFAAAPDYYFRKGVDLTKITEISQLLPIVNTKPDAELVADLNAATDWAKSQGGDIGK